MKKLDKEAKKRAAQLLADVNKKIEKAIKEIRESQGDRQVIKKARQSIEQLRSELQSEEKKPQGKKIEIAELKAGQKVKSLQFNFEGVISKIFKSKRQWKLIGMVSKLPYRLRILN